MRCYLGVFFRRIAIPITLLCLVLANVVPVSYAQGPTSPVSVSGQDTLLFVGDSLTVGADWFGKMKPRIESLDTWSQVVIDAKTGRKATLGAVTLKNRMTSSVSAIVIALGTNDMISRREPNYPPKAIDAVMAQSAGLPVLWFNIKFSPTGRGDWRFRGLRFNRALRDAQTRWPNLMIADWNKSFVPSGKSRYISDGVHLTVSGYKTRANFTVAQLKTFGQAIVDATTTTTTTPITTTSTTTTATTPTTSTTTTQPNAVLP